MKFNENIYDTFVAKHMIACFLLGFNILPHRHGSERLNAINACEHRGWVIGKRESK